MTDRRRPLTSTLRKEESAAVPPGIGELFRDWHGLVFRTAYRITGNPADAEDVLQTVFLRLLTSSGGARPERPEPYFRRAAVNASLDVVRARQHQAQAPLDPETAGRWRADDTGLREGLRRALAALKPQWAEIFTLRFIEGWTNGEIAAALSLSPVLVAVIVHRARRQLQNEIRKYV